MKITRDRALNILKYLDKNADFYFPFQIICQDFHSDSEYSGVSCTEINYEIIDNNDLFVNFILEENLQNLYPETIKLMAEGFLNKIENTNALSKISDLAIEYRKNWKENICESEDIDEYGLNEFIGGKADAYEDCKSIFKSNF